MHGSKSLLASATLLLAVMMFTALPRTLFHHCEEGAPLVARHDLAGTVHGDTHCAICEAPVPFCAGLANFSVHWEVALLGTQVTRSAIVQVHTVPTTLRLRGPPKEC